MIEKQVGERIKLLRKVSGFSQAKLATILGVDQTHISKIEKGIKQPSIHLLGEICRLFEVKPDYVLFGDTSTSEKDLSPEQLLKKISSKTNRDLYVLLTSYRQVVLEMSAVLSSLQESSKGTGEPHWILQEKKGELSSALSTLRYKLESLFYHMEEKEGEKPRFMTVLPLGTKSSKPNK